jgi:hypothetical protein
VGDTGPAGGIIVFVDRFAEQDGFTYLEVAPPGWNLGSFDPMTDPTDPSLPFCSEAIGLGAEDAGGVTTTLLPGRWSARALGAGLASTVALLETAVCADSGAVAAAFGHSVTVDGTIYDDWYVPSISELELSFRVLSQLGIGDLSARDLYWSSSFLDDVAIFGIQSGQIRAHAQLEEGFLHSHLVRPVRRFS